MKGKTAGFFLAAGIFFFSILSAREVYAAEQTEKIQTSEKEEPDFEYIDQWLASCDLGEINEGIGQLFPGIHLDGGELLSMILRGEAGEAFRLLVSQVREGIAGEIASLKQILVLILVLGIVSALFSEFSDLFAGGQIAKAGFYFLYLFLMGILTKVFLFVSEIASSAVGNIVMFIKLFIPTYFTAVGAAQGAAAAMYYYQLMLVLAYLVESFLNSLLLPLICSFVMLALLNGLWEEEKLSLLLDFIEKAIVLALKVSMGAVTGLSLVQALVVPAASRLKLSAMRKALSSIPGIGSVVEGMTELMLGSAVLIKNSMGVLLLVLIFGALALPLLKILIITGTVKLGAAVTGIVSDKRISACADRVGQGCLLLLRCVFTAVILFVIVIAVISYTAST